MSEPKVVVPAGGGGGSVKALLTATLSVVAALLVSRSTTLLPTCSRTRCFDANQDTDAVLSGLGGDYKVGLLLDGHNVESDPALESFFKLDDYLKMKGLKATTFVLKLDEDPSKNAWMRQHNLRTAPTFITFETMEGVDDLQVSALSCITCPPATILNLLEMAKKSGEELGVKEDEEGDDKMDAKNAYDRSIDKQLLDMLTNFVLANTVQGIHLMSLRQYGSEQKANKQFSDSKEAKKERVEYQLVASQFLMETARKGYVKGFAALKDLDKDIGKTGTAEFKLEKKVLKNMLGQSSEKDNSGELSLKEMQDNMPYLKNADLPDIRRSREAVAHQIETHAKGSRGLIKVIREFGVEVSKQMLKSGDRYPLKMLDKFSSQTIMSPVERGKLRLLIHVGHMIKNRKTEQLIKEEKEKLKAKEKEKKTAKIKKSDMKTMGKAAKGLF